MAGRRAEVARGQLRADDSEPRRHNRERPGTSSRRGADPHGMGGRLGDGEDRQPIRLRGFLSRPPIRRQRPIFLHPRHTPREGESRSSANHADDVSGPVSPRRIQGERQGRRSSRKRRRRDELSMQRGAPAGVSLGSVRVHEPDERVARPGIHIARRFIRRGHVPTRREPDRRLPSQEIPRLEPRKGGGRTVDPARHLARVRKPDLPQRRPVVCDRQRLQ